MKSLQKGSIVSLLVALGTLITGGVSGYFMHHSHQAPTQTAVSASSSATVGANAETQASAAATQNTAASSQNNCGSINANDATPTPADVADVSCMYHSLYSCTPGQIAFSGDTTPREEVVNGRVGDNCSISFTSYGADKLTQTTCLIPVSLISAYANAFNTTAHSQVLAQAELVVGATAASSGSIKDSLTGRTDYFTCH